MSKMVNVSDISEDKLLWFHEVEDSGLRTYRAPLVLSLEQENVLTRLGERMFREYAENFQWFLDNGCPRGGVEHTRFRARLTQRYGSRWGGSILSAVKAQATLSINAFNRHKKDLERKIVKLEKLLASGKRVRGHKRKPLKPKEYFDYCRLLGEYRERLGSLVFNVTLGGRWERVSAPERYREKRFFLQAQGESGKVGGNETLSVRGGVLRINVPKCLKGEFGDKVYVSMPVFVCGQVDLDRALECREPVSVGVRRVGGGFEVFVQVRHERGVCVGARKRVLGIDLNYDHLAVAVLDESGNPVGAGHRIMFDSSGSGSHTLAQVRHAVTVLSKLSRRVGAGVWVIEKLDGFSNGKSRVDNNGGGRFRKLVSNIPASVFRQEFARVAYNLGVVLREVPPHYSSQLAHYWSGEEIPVHNGAAIVIGRRGLGYSAHRVGSVVVDKQQTTTHDTPIKASAGSEQICHSGSAHRAPTSRIHDWLNKQSCTVKTA